MGRRTAKLSDLKTLFPGRARSHSAPERGTDAGAPAAKPSPAARAKHADADVDLRQAFADVARLPPANRASIAKPQPSSTPVMRLRDEAAALEASKYGAEPSPSTWEVGQEHEAEQTFRRPGLGSDVLVKLRRGHWVVQGELDLHGSTASEARDALADYLVDARMRGWRCVRVIHGKGLSSPNREPVLKSKVRRWLAQWDDVLAYCEAPRHGGGSGAVIVLLKAQPSARKRDPSRLD